MRCTEKDLLGWVLAVEVHTPAPRTGVAPRTAETPWVIGVAMIQPSPSRYQLASDAGASTRPRTQPKVPLPGPAIGGILAACLGLLLCCDSQPPLPSAERSHPPSERQPAGATAAIRCPAGMSAVPPAPSGRGGFCIDSYEVVVEGPLGDADQTRPGATPPRATARSEPGVIPSTGASFGQAVHICENTPVVDDNGRVVGRKHLATTAEWEDAGDGVPGPGGATYPWGETWEDDRCVTLGPGGEQRFDALQPTGSMPGCVSPFGVYDQVGNAWEWVDAGLHLDVDAWFRAAARLGHSVAVDADGRLLAPQLELDAFLLEGNGVAGELFLTDAGHIAVRLGADSVSIGDGERTGYLVISELVDPPPVDGYLPVQMLAPSPQDTEAVVELHLRRDRDGAAMPDKRGCAFYVGWVCNLRKSAFHHDVAANLTVGFRCACDPLPGG